MVLPVNIDTVYADDGADASVKLHQQHHDTIHAAINTLTAGRAAFVRYTTGNITLNSNVWANMPSLGTCAVAAAVGDILEASVNLRVGTENVALSFDVVSEVSASPVNSFGSGAAAPGQPSGWSATAAQASSITGSVMYTVQSGDISGGTVTCRLRYFGASATNRTASASATSGIHFSVKNLGPA